jgi:Zn ribbon nucleic-acid-binding protein
MRYSLRDVIDRLRVSPALPPCPACGATATFAVETKRVQTFHCNPCGHAWTPDPEPIRYRIERRMERIPMKEAERVTPPLLVDYGAPEESV